MTENKNIDNKTKTYEFYAMDWKTGFNKGIYFILWFSLFLMILLIIPPITIFRNEAFYSIGRWFKIGYVLWVFISVKITLTLVKLIISKKNIHFYIVSMNKNLMIIKKNNIVDFECNPNEVTCFKKVEHKDVAHYIFKTKSGLQYSFSNGFVIKGKYLFQYFTNKNLCKVMELSDDIIDNAFLKHNSHVIKSPIYRELKIYKK